MKLAFAAAGAFCALSVSARADCVVIGALGDGLTHDLAVIMSTHGLATIIESKGRKPEGPVHTKCDTGSFLTECHSSQKACK